MNISTSKRKLRLGAVLLAVTFLPPTISAALAEPSMTVRQQAVPYGDLDLSKIDGLETLNRRIAMAISSVCGHSEPRESSSARDERECREQARARATADVEALRGADGFDKK